MTSENKDNEWEERTLCSDEACIGVIGPNGRCNECDKPYAGKLLENDAEPLEGLALDSDDPLDPDDAEADDPADDLDDVDLEEADDSEADDSEADDSEADDHWTERILCRDENCIGVIGSDGCCKECGLSLEEDA